MVANGSSLLPAVARVSGQIIRENADELADMVRRAYATQDRHLHFD